MPLLPVSSPISITFFTESILFLSSRRNCPWSFCQQKSEWIIEKWWPKWYCEVCLNWQFSGKTQFGANTGLSVNYIQDNYTVYWSTQGTNPPAGDYLSTACAVRAWMSAFTTVGCSLHKLLAYSCRTRELLLTMGMVQGQLMYLSSIRRYGWILSIHYLIPLFRPHSQS